MVITTVQRRLYSDDLPIMDKATEYGYVLWIVIAADTLYSVLLLMLLLLRLCHGRYEVLLAVEFGLVILIP